MEASTSERRNKTGAVAIVLSAASIVACAVVLVVASCGTFRPIGDVDKMEPECVYSLNVMRIYGKADEKSGIVPSIESCLRCMKKLRCQREVYGIDRAGEVNPVDYDDFAKFKRYTACKGEL